MSNINNKVWGKFLKEPILPAFYRDYANIFFKEAAQALAEYYGDLDHAINFNPGVKLPHPEITRKTATETWIERD